jgi:hypothetical protein
MSEKYYCLSYIPMDLNIFNSLNGTHSGLDIMGIAKSIEEHALETDAMACFWTTEPGIVLGFDKADILADFTKMWSEDNISEWFTISSVRDDNKYVILIMPDITKSLERFQYRMLLTNEKIVNKEDIQVIFRPLMFISTIIGNYNESLFKADKVKVSLIDEQDARMIQDHVSDPEDESFEMPLPIVLGEIPVNHDSYSEHLKKILKEGQ